MINHHANRKVQPSYTLTEKGGEGERGSGREAEIGTERKRQSHTCRRGSQRRGEGERDRGEEGAVEGRHRDGDTRQREANCSLKSERLRGDLQ